MRPHRLAEEAQAPPRGKRATGMQINRELTQQYIFLIYDNFSNNKHFVSKDKVPFFTQNKEVYNSLTNT
ncbi:hypothetical protein AB685_07735 [Bacillus sp. LL01]|nr:hypothetical protein AB685_07735 [Bacillus sp. LL01]